MTDCSFLDMIRPGDIAYVIALVKNGRDVWDQTFEYRQSALQKEAKRTLTKGRLMVQKELLRVRS
jgi:hypothetical protein